MISYTRGQFWSRRSTLPVTGHFVDTAPEYPALGFGLVLRPSVVAGLLLQAGRGDLPPAAGGTPPGLAVNDAPDELVDAAVPRRHGVAPLIEQEIIWRFLSSDQGTVVRDKRPRRSCRSLRCSRSVS
jgi:hypothetical protein